MALKGLVRAHGGVPARSACRMAGSEVLSPSQIAKNSAASCGSRSPLRLAVENERKALPGTVDAHQAVAGFDVGQHALQCRLPALRLRRVELSCAPHLLQ
jgi:hypothetical protein